MIYRPSGFWQRQPTSRANIFKNGIWELRAEPNGSGDSRITVINDRRPKGKGFAFAPMMMLNGKKILAGHLQKTLDLLAREPHT